MKSSTRNFIDQLKRLQDQRKKDKENMIDMDEYFKPSKMKEKHIRFKKKHESQN